MSTLLIDFENSALSFGGGIADYVNGTTRIRHVGPALAEMDFSFVGTAISINGLIPDGCTVSIDGGGSSAIDNTSGGFGSSVLATGLTDNGAVHTLHLSLPNCYLNAIGTFTITYGTNVGSVSVASGFGPTYNLWNASVLAAVDPEGLIQLAGQGSVYQPEIASFAWANSQLRFRATCTGIYIYTKKQGQKFALYIDGVKQVSLTTIANDNSFGWVSLFTGLSAGAEHEYRVMLVNNNDIIYSTTYQLMLVGGSLNSAILAQKPVIEADGDSEIAGWANADASTGLLQLIADANGWTAFNKGQNSKTVRQFIGNTNAGGAYDVFSGESPHPGQSTYATTNALRCSRVRHRNVKAVLLWMGTNDMANLPSYESVTEFQASYTNMLKRWLSERSGVGIVVIPIGPRNDISEGTRATWNAAIVAAILAVGNSAVIYAADAFTGVTSADTSDGVHFTVAGVAKIYTNIAPYVNAAAVGRTNFLNSGIGGLFGQFPIGV